MNTMKGYGFAYFAWLRSDSYFLVAANRRFTFFRKFEDLQS